MEAKLREQARQGVGLACNWTRCQITVIPFNNTIALRGRVGQERREDGRGKERGSRLVTCLLAVAT